MSELWIMRDGYPDDEDGLEGVHVGGKVRGDLLDRVLDSKSDN